jgi:hypothetical protein
MSWVLEALDRYARSLQRDDDRHSTCGASDVGQCARKIYCDKNEGDPDYGVTRNPDFMSSWGATLRGVLIENYFMVPALREAYGDKFQRAGAEQKTLTLAYLSGTPDAIFADMPSDALAHLGVPALSGDGSLPAEFKSIDPRVALGAETGARLPMSNAARPHSRADASPPRILPARLRGRVVSRRGP